MRSVTEKELAEALGDALHRTWEHLAFRLRMGVVKSDEWWRKMIDDYGFDDLAEDLQSSPVVQPLAQAVRQGSADASVHIGVMFNLVDPNAVRWAHSRAAEMVGRTWNNGRLVDNPNPRLSIVDGTRDGIKSLVAQHLATGGSWVSIQEGIERLPGFGGTIGQLRAETIARSEVAMAANHGFTEVCHKAGVTQVDVVDNPHCPACAPFDGTRQTIQWARDNPIQHPNCLPGWVEVVAPNCTASFDRMYEGKIVVLRTASGKKMSATINHPILTPRGWVPVGLLKTGDYVISHGQHEGFGRSVPHGDHRPTRIEQIARSLGPPGTVTTAVMPMSTEDFHGDGMDGDIYVVRTYGHQGLSLPSPLDQPSRHLQVQGPDSNLVGLSSLCPRHQILHRSFGSADSCVSRINPMRMFSLGSGRSINAVPTFYASFNQPMFDGPSRYPQDGGRLLKRLAGQVEADRLVHIEQHSFVGHVYNLETKVGWYTAGGIITHNCTRSFRAVL